MMNQRAVIAKIFTDILVHGKTLNDALIKNKATEDAFIKAHCYGLCRWYFQLEAMAQQLLTKSLKEKDTDVYALILLGLHQIFYSDIKSHALVHETVTAVQELKKNWAKALINACLRRALREKETLLTIINDNKSPTVYYAHSSWMVNSIKKSWPNHWQKILEANNHQAPMTLRINTKRTHEMSEKLPWLSQKCVNLITPLPVKDIAGFNEGIISVQDEASQYAAPLLQLQPQDYVLDACAAPGGKTGHMLELESTLHLTALDISKQRLEKVKENLQRLKIKNPVKFITADAAETKGWFDGVLFNKILIDAPCSGTGVVRRHPDIKLLRRDDDLKKFSEQQKQLLNALWLLLKKNGYLLYTTCSIMPEENEHVIAQFLNAHSDARTKSIYLPIGEPQQHGWQCFPKIEGNDGFYYCLLEKIDAH